MKKKTNITNPLEKGRFLQEDKIPKCSQCSIIEMYRRSNKQLHDLFITYAGVVNNLMLESRGNLSDDEKLAVKDKLIDLLLKERKIKIEPSLN
ncbi:MAG: hypothetical protein EHM20_00680 [Alphaproteobacteria bacterium]|nr:MAG: hypothetical protein EHM20_00680 [Alphaproteobacteria bacterium]